MPLVYYRDNAYAPVPTGNAYAELTKIDPLLLYHAKWKYLSPTMREDAIVNASAQLNVMGFSGAKVSPTQPLKFPREYDETEGLFSYEGQDERLLEALAAQVEYNLSRTGIGVTSYSHGNESVTPRQDMICREALFALEPFVRDA